MKNLYTFLAIVAVPAILILTAYSSGSPGGRTGSPGDGGNTCAECHSGNSVINQEGWITSDIPAEGYTPGISYTITLTGNHEFVQKFGFEMTAESDDQLRVGEFINLGTETQYVAGDDQRITHTSQGTTPTGDTKTWETTWTAPEIGVGKVTFYAALNAANGNGTNSGDQIYTTKLAVNESTTGIADLGPGGLVKIYPNPANSILNIELPGFANIRIVDIAGQEVMNIEEVPERGSIDVSSLSRGIYFVNVNTGSETATLKMLKN